MNTLVALLIVNGIAHKRNIVDAICLRAVRGFFRVTHTVKNDFQLSNFVG